MGWGECMSSLWYDATVIASLNAAAALLNAGTIKIYSGTQPALNAAVTGTLLVTLTFSGTAFATATASGGVVTATANTITSGTAVATATAGYFVLEDSSAAVKISGTVGVSGADLNMTSLSIVAGITVSCSAFSLTSSETGT